MQARQESDRRVGISFYERLDTVGSAAGSRVRLWKLELQKLADGTGLAIAVSHIPPGTSKWNKIEHRLFSYISKNWRGRPLTSLKVIGMVPAGVQGVKGNIERFPVSLRKHRRQLICDDVG